MFPYKNNLLLVLLIIDLKFLDAKDIVRTG